jgi:hypothetical protein
MADDPNVARRTIGKGRAREARHVSGVVAHGRVTTPRAGAPMPGQVRGDDAVAGRGQCRPDPPPAFGAGRHAMHDHERVRRHVAPGEGVKRDPAGLDAEVLRRIRYSQGVERRTLRFMGGDGHGPNVPWPPAAPRPSVAA